MRFMDCNPIRLKRKDLFLLAKQFRFCKRDRHVENNPKRLE